MLEIFFQILGGWVYSHLSEYSIHRWILHKAGKKRGHLFSFHFHSHHFSARKNAMFDPSYDHLRWDAHGKELASLLFLAIVHSPLVMIWPWSYGTILFSITSYYLIHRRAHTKPEWGRVFLSWHYDHHMGPDQDKNWGVRTAWLDTLFRTREKYYGTRRERIEFQRRLIRTLNRQRRLR